MPFSTYISVDLPPLSQSRIITGNNSRPDPASPWRPEGLRGLLDNKDLTNWIREGRETNPPVSGACYLQMQHAISHSIHYWQEWEDKVYICSFTHFDCSVFTTLRHSLMLSSVLTHYNGCQWFFFSSKLQIFRFSQHDFWFVLSSFIAASDIMWEKDEILSLNSNHLMCIIPMIQWRYKAG